MSTRKLLYLFRHAEAVQKSSHFPDKERELTPTGVRQSVEMGAYLSRQGTVPEMIIASSSARTRQTTALAAERMKIEESAVRYEDDLYEASTRTLLDFIHRLDDGWSSVMCVGHNPTMSYLAEYLTKKEIGDMALAGIVIIEYTISSWTDVKEGNGTLVRYIHPANLPQD